MTGKWQIVGDGKVRRPLACWINEDGGVTLIRVGAAPTAEFYIEPAEFREIGGMLNTAQYEQDRAAVQEVKRTLANTRRYDGQITAMSQGTTSVREQSIAKFDRDQAESE